MTEMRPLFKSEKIVELEKCLYEARKELRRYWAAVLVCLPDIKESCSLSVQQLYMI